MMKKILISTVSVLLFISFVPVFFNNGSVSDNNLNTGQGGQNSGFITQTALAAETGIKLDPSYYPSGAPTIGGQNPEAERVSTYTVDTVRNQLLKKILYVLLATAGVVAIYSILVNAMWLAMSSGSEEMITERKKGLMWAILGLVLVILSFSIIRFLISLPWQVHQEAPAAEKSSSSAIEGGQLRGPDVAPPSPFSGPSLENNQLDFGQTQMRQDGRLNEPSFGGTPIYGPETGGPDARPYGDFGGDRSG